MTRRHEIKGNETIALRVPDKIDAALTAEALWNETTKSELMRRILEQRYADGQQCKHLDLFANKSAEIQKALEAASNALGKLMCMVTAGGKRMQKETA